MGRSKLLYLGIPFLLLIAYLMYVPAPHVNKIYIQGDLGYLAESYQFTIVSLTPRGQIAQLSSINFPYTVNDLTITPGYAYVITNDRIVYILDVGDSSHPRKLAEFSTAGIPKSIAVNGSTVYIADQAGSVHILSVTIPSLPIEVGSIVKLGAALDVDVIGNLVYIARGTQGLDIYDTSNPAEPKHLGHYDTGGNLEQIAVEKIIADGNETIRATLIIGKRVVQIVDLTNAQQPTLLNSFDFGAVKIEQALITDKKLFVAQRKAGLLISSIKNNGELERLVNINTPRSTLGFALRDNTVYLATGWEGLQAFDITKLDRTSSVGTGYSRFWNHKILIILSTFIFLSVWLAFFAQFVLPVHTAYQRQKIFDRLIIFLLGRHGAAIFVQDGHKIERAGESEKRGPGVVWLDTASAAVIRTATKFKEAIGPGVHFIKKRETIAGPLDLHTQVDSLGPKEEEKPFDKQTDAQSIEAYREIQHRRKMTSALTRDGIEVVPNIMVIFRVDTQPTHGDESGSRFGYRTGITTIDKENEEKDKEAIFKAIAGEGIDPTIPRETPRHRIAWNQLPGRLAVDVWREYVAKFTLDELFAPTQETPQELHSLSKPKPEEIEALKHPISVSANSETRRSGMADLLRIINHSLASLADWIDGKKVQKGEPPNINIATSRPSITREKADTAKQTALQVITDMVKKRLTQAKVESLDKTGVPTKDTDDSKEFGLLCNRGLKVLSVSISNLRFQESVEKYLIDHWSANWYNNAKAERERIERRRRFVEIQGEEDGANEYVHALARHIMKQRPSSTAETLRALLMRTQLTIVKNDQLQYRMSTERQDIGDLLQWVEDKS